MGMRRGLLWKFGEMRDAPCDRGLPDRCTNDKGPPCLPNSSCQHASGYYVCKQGFCDETGWCEVPCPQNLRCSHSRALTREVTVPSWIEMPPCLGLLCVLEDACSSLQLRHRER